MTPDPELFRRAAAQCIVAEPHRDADETPPCDRHLLDASRQLAIPAPHLSAPASSPAASGPPPAGAGLDGGPGRVLRPPARPSQDGASTLQTNNRPGDQTRAAEGATAIAQNEGYR